MNINSISNKFQRLIGMIDKNIDILCIAETKIDSTYPTHQFSIPGYREPYRLDGPKIRECSGGLLVYIREDIPSKLLTSFKIKSDLQVLPIEINLKNAKWVIIPIYRPPSKDKCEFNESLINMLDFYYITH